MTPHRSRGGIQPMTTEGSFALLMVVIVTSVVGGTVGGVLALWLTAG